MYIKPSKRRLSDYEAVSTYVQVDPDQPYVQYYMRTEEGRAAWRPESTRLTHPHWYDFRDPGRYWQRNYVRMQAEQERAIARLVEDAKVAGSLQAIDPTWVTRILRDHHRVWSFFEYGLFRAFAVASREALSDPIGQALSFQGFDHMRHAQAVVLFLLDLEGDIDGFLDRGAKERWLGEPAYQPLRALAERAMAFDDWAELCVVTNFVLLPLIAEVGVGSLLRENAPAHGDLATPVIVLTTERDRRRNRAVASELARMALEEKNPGATANRAVIRGWFESWQGPALEAAQALAPIWNDIPHPVRSFDAALENARSTQRALVEEHGLAEYLP
jgi:methane monooxygenase component A beta chain/propane monooxygenase small subunit